MFFLYGGIMQKFNKFSFALEVLLLKLSKHTALLVLILIAGRLSGYSPFDQSALIILTVISLVLHQTGKYISMRKKIGNMQE